MPVSRQQAALISARSLLTQQDVRLVELLKEWDENEDGTVDRSEFRKVLPALGLLFDQSTCDELFDSLLVEVLTTRRAAGEDERAEGEAATEIEHWELFRGLHAGQSPEEIEKAEADAKAKVAKQQAVSTRHDKADGTWHRDDDGRAVNRHALRKKKGPIKTTQGTRVGARADFQDMLGNKGREFVDDLDAGQERAKGTLGVGIFLHADMSLEEQIAAALHNRHTRVMDVFKAWDESGDGRISPREFRRAMASIGVRATKDELDGVFGSWDETSNGSIEFEEMDRILRRVARDAKEREAAAEAFDNQEDNGKLRRLISGVGGGGEGEGEGEGGQRTPGSLWRSKTKGIALGAVLTDNTSPLDQLRKAILGKGTAMITLFRSWDVDLDGKVSKSEFRDAVVMLKCTMDTDMIDSLFNKLDPDRSGKIEYAELDKILRRDLHEEGAALPPSIAHRLFPRTSFVYVLGPPAKAKKTVCKRLAYMFRGTWLCEKDLKERELETPGSKLSPEIRQLEDVKKPLTPRLIKACLRRAFAELPGPFFFFDLPASPKHLELLEKEFGEARLALELILDEWKGDEVNVQGLADEYRGREKLLRLDGSMQVDLLVKKVENYMTVQSRRERIETLDASQAKREADADLVIAQRQYLVAATARVIENRHAQAKQDTDLLQYTLTRQAAAWRQALSCRAQTVDSYRQRFAAPVDPSAPPKSARPAKGFGPPWRPHGPPRVFPGTVAAWDGNLADFTAPLAPLPGAPRSPRATMSRTSQRDLILPRKLHTAGSRRPGSRPHEPPPGPPSYLTEPSSLPGVMSLYGGPHTPRPLLTPLVPPSGAAGA
mmetsp:Transcript_61387/g.162498  ORF Transcript_61387/g.162498 Transcript_61387/m.162498 type:complete len:831 (-) Transcript_61387:221-2713(-)